MAKFRLTEGEKVIDRARCRDATGHWNEHRLVILTDRRIVVVNAVTSLVGSIFGAYGALRMAGVGCHIEYAIARDQLLSAEAVSNKELTVRSRGEGYAALRIDLVVKAANVWADQLHRWAAGTEEAAGLPSATLRERD
jgi:hypothetical protein